MWHSAGLLFVLVVSMAMVAALAFGWVDIDDDT